LTISRRANLLILFTPRNYNKYLRIVTFQVKNKFETKMAPLVMHIHKCGKTQKVLIAFDKIKKCNASRFITHSPSRSHKQQKILSCRLDFHLCVPTSSRTFVLCCCRLLALVGAPARCEFLHIQFALPPRSVELVEITRTSLFLLDKC
jgi:hypothetical protein